MKISIDIFEGFNVFVTGNLFKNIIAALSFTDLRPQYFNDKFFKIPQMIVAWNNHLKYLFITSWVCCLNDSISI